MSYSASIVIATLALAACGGGGDSEHPSVHYFYGDSITLGFGVADTESYVAKYADKLQAARVYRLATPDGTNGGISNATLPAQRTGVGAITVVRDGGGGRPLVSVNGAGLLRDYSKGPGLQAPFSVFVIQTGINDAIVNEWKQSTPSQFGVNLTSLIALAKRDAERVYLLAPTYVQSSVSYSVAPYIAVMREVSRTTGVRLIAPPTDDAWYGVDVYHPNAAGHKMIGDYVFNVINP